MDGTQTPRNQTGRFLYYSHLAFLLFALLEALLLFTGALDILNTETPAHKAIRYIAHFPGGQVVADTLVQLTLFGFILLFALPFLAVVNVVTQVVLRVRGVRVTGRLARWLVPLAFVAELILVGFLAVGLCMHALK